MRSTRGHQTTLTSASWLWGKAVLSPDLGIGVIYPE